MGIFHRLFGRKVKTDHFSAKRISKNEFLVKFDNEAETVMSEEDFTALLQMDDTTIQSLSFKFNGTDSISDLFKNLLRRFYEDAKAKQSKAGERVTLRVVQESEEDLPDNMVRKSGRYEIVGDSGKVIQTDTFYVEFGKDSPIDLRELYKVLAQLSWSGTHATNADALRYYEAVGAEMPEGYKTEVQGA